MGGVSPERPASVPNDARYVPELPGWEHVARNAGGEPDGERRQYRDDGTLACVDRFEAGRRVGEFSLFHPNGDLLGRGTYVDDRLDGTLFRFASAAPGGEPLRSCCVPRSAVELRAEYRRGRLLDEVYYDAEGRPLASDGTPWPERPPGVPERAVFDAHSRRYVLYEENDDGTEQLRRYYAATGLRQEEFAIVRGRSTTRRLFDAAGNLRWESGLDEKGRLTGPSREILAPATSPFSDPRVVEVRGGHLHGEGTGTWELLDATGTVVRRFERGAPFAVAPAAVLHPEPSDVDAADILRNAVSARAEGRAREAVCLAARAAARARDPESLRRFLADSVLPLTPAAALRRAENFVEAEAATASGLLDAVLAGGDAGRLLSALASVLPAWSKATLDYLEAAALLAPDRPLVRMARALVRLEHGDREGALADANLLEAESPEAAALVREECRFVFPAFRFQPLEHPVEDPGEDFGEIPLDQPLPAVRRAVMLYATRLSLIRSELARRVGGEPDWLPPRLDALLPDGPLELHHHTVVIRDEDEGEVEESEVEIDETLAFDERSTRQLLAVARADHAALTWLCWSAGLTEVALPEVVSPPSLFVAAANRSTQRCFWAHDRLRTGGLVAMTRKVPRFDWEGIGIDQLPAHLAKVAAAEMLEVRAMFLWSLFEENVSVFQADLRKA
jgi:hypothetical protein